MESQDLSIIGEHKLFKNLPDRLPLNNQKCCRLVASNGDCIYIWDSVNYSLDSIRVKSIIRDEDFTSLLQINPSPVILFRVEAILLNSSSSLVALFGANGVAVVILPSQSRTVDGTVDARCVSLSSRDFVSKSYKVRQCRWHPGSELDSHLLVLTSDECLRLYNTLNGAVLWTCSLTRHALRNSINMMASGETPVDFELIPQEGEKWPILVLYGNGEVGILRTHLKEEKRKMSVFGPLRMLPESDDNYGVDASSILVLQTTPPIVVLSTCSGTLYHCLLLSSDEAENNKDPGKALYVVESVELELGMMIGEEVDEDVVSCPIRLEADPVEKSRYLCIHNGGVHTVTLPLVGKLQKFINSSEEEFAPYKIGSIAEYILCTGFISESGLETNPILGLTHVDLDNYLGILHQWKPVILQMPSYVTYSTLPLEFRSESNFAVTIQTMLKDGNLHKPPILKLPLGSSVKEWLELILKVTQQYKTVFSHYSKASALLHEKVQKLNLSMRSQRALAERLSEEKASLQATAESIAERYEEANDKQAVLIERVKAIAVNMRSDQNLLSPEEKEVLTFFENAEVRARQFEKEINRVQAVHESNQKEGGPNTKSIFLPDNKVKLIRTHLEKLNLEVSQLIKRVKGTQILAKE